MHAHTHLANILRTANRDGRSLYLFSSTASLTISRLIASESKAAGAGANRGYVSMLPQGCDEALTPIEIGTLWPPVFSQLAKAGHYSLLAVAT